MGITTTHTQASEEREQVYVTHHAFMHSSWRHTIRHGMQRLQALHRSVDITAEAVSAGQAEPQTSSNSVSAMQDLTPILAQASESSSANPNLPPITTAAPAPLLPKNLSFPSEDSAGPAPITPTAALADALAASNIQQQLVLLQEMQEENTRLRAFVSTYMASSDKVWMCMCAGLKAPQWQPYKAHAAQPIATDMQGAGINSTASHPNNV